MRMMPRSSRSARISSERFGMSRVISSAPSLVSRASTSCSSMWIDVSTSSLHQALREDDGVLVVVALPRHEGHEQVLAQGQLTVVGGRAVGQDVAGGDLLALLDDDLLVDGGVLVGTAELGQPVGLLAEDGADAILRTGLVLDDDLVARDVDHGTVGLGHDHVARVTGGAGFDARADVGGLGYDQRHGLLLHVGAHQGPVGVVVLDEGDQRRRDRHDLLRATRP